jgi:hypothetical protein
MRVSPHFFLLFGLFWGCGDKEEGEGSGDDGFSDGGDGASDGADGASDGADGASDGTDGGEPEGWWYSTCGDPVCGGYRGPTDGIPVCTDQVEGEPCAPLDAACDREDDCNTLFVCALVDPKDQPGGCPISQRATKTDIVPLSAQERGRAADLALRLPLSTWRYRTDPPEDPVRLGFIIEDLNAQAHPALRPEGGRVDLYGLSSLTLAAVQHQAVQIERLENERRQLEQQLLTLTAENRALDQRLDRLEAQLSRPATPPR